MLIAKLQVYIHSRTETCNDLFKSKDSTIQNVYIEFFLFTDSFSSFERNQSGCCHKNMFQGVLAFVCLFRNVLMSSTMLIFLGKIGNSQIDVLSATFKCEQDMGQLLFFRVEDI